MAFRIMQTRLTWVPEKDRPESGDALVIPANDRLWMLSGPGLEIKKALGKEIEVEAVRQGPVEPGRSVFTSGQALGYKHLIHAAVMGQDFHWIPGAGGKAIQSALEIARLQKTASMVLYPLYRGIRGRHEEPAREMLEAILAGLQEGCTLQTVQVLYGEAEEKKLLHETFVHLLAHPRI